MASSTDDAGGHRSTGLSSYVRNEHLEYWFAVPALAILLALVIFPMIWSLWTSFTDLNLSIASANGAFVGFENYAELLANDRFWNSIANTAYYVGLGVTVAVTLTFGMIRLLPGGPLVQLRAQLIRQGVDPSEINGIIESYQNLRPDQPLYIQYFDYVSSLLTGDLGESVRYGEPVRIPTGHVGFVLPRSTLLRNGCTLDTAVWDAGYEGVGEGRLDVGHGIDIEAGARIGQLVLARADHEGTYDGTYQGENR